MACLTKAALAVLLLVHICLVADGQSSNNDGGSCLDVIDVALVVDVSGSIEGDGKYPGRFDTYVKKFLELLVKRLFAVFRSVRTGLVTFGNYGTLEFGLSSDVDEVVRRIDRFSYQSRGKNTNTSGGINVMRTELLSPKDPNYRINAAHVAFIVTDGKPSYDTAKTIPSAKAAQREGTAMLVVGVTNEVNVTELKDICSPFAPVDIQSLQNGKTNGVFMLTGSVAYVPELADLSAVVDPLVTHFTKTVCTPSCPTGDKESWCGTVRGSGCSAATIKAICCKTCP